MNRVELLTISEAAQRLHVSRQTIYAWIHNGRIRPVLTPGGRQRIPEDQLIIGQPVAVENFLLDAFPIRNISELEPIQNEPMGTKEKYWFSRTDKYWYWEDLGKDYGEFLFKAGREGTGENWAEKIVSELCTLLDLPHAEYDLAAYKNKRGVISPTFVPAGASLWHGNQILSSYIQGYEKSIRYHQTQHTVNTVLGVLGDEQIKLPLGWSNNAKLNLASDIFTGYLMLDAWIANTDRHHENWGLLIFPEDKSIRLAPTFDHASSLGRNVTDDERTERLNTKDAGRNVDHYVQRAKSAFYLDQEDPRLLTTLAAFEQAAARKPEAAKYWLETLRQVSQDEVESIIRKVPDEEMTEISKEFTWTILELNRNRLLSLKV